MSAALQPPSLPPEALEIIKAGTPKPQTTAPILNRVEPLPRLAEETRGGEEADKKPIIKVRAVTPRPGGRQAKELEPGASVAFSFRLPSHLPPALLRASSERKLARTRPFTQQDIISEALSDWLRKHGYLE